MSEQNSQGSRKKQIQEFLSQFHCNPHSKDQPKEQLLYKKSITSEQFQNNPLQHAKTLRQTPYAILADKVSQNQEKAELNTKTETKREFTEKPILPFHQEKISDKDLWYADRRSKVVYPGKKVTETKDSFKRNEIVKSQFEYPNLYEHHFSFGSGHNKIQGETMYKKQFSKPESEGTVQRKTNDLIPNNEIKKPNTYANGISTHYQQQFERKPHCQPKMVDYNNPQEDNWPRLGNVKRRSHYDEVYNS